MYTRMLIPLDGSKVAEQVLPYARFLAKALTIPVELLEVVDPEALALLSNPKQGRYVDTILAEGMESSKNYLETIGRSFQGAKVKSLVEKGKAEDVVIEKAAADKNTLIVMATHGRSGIQRWLLGSVADKVLHGATNHLFLVRASDQGKTDGGSRVEDDDCPARWLPVSGAGTAVRCGPHKKDEAQSGSYAVLRAADLRCRRGLRVLLR